MFSFINAGYAAWKLRNTYGNDAPMIDGEYAIKRE